MFDFEKCEKVIGYSFKDKKLLMQCFTHSSFTNEHKQYKNNERLEFLGDSILGFVITAYLYKKYQNEDEGFLTQQKQAFVSKEPLSKASINNGFNEFLVVGEGIKNQSNNKNLCENLFESIIAGIYIDGGLANAKDFIKRFLLDGKTSNQNFKGVLQEYVQKNHLGEIKYVDCGVSGPKHNLMFYCEIFIGEKRLGSGEASSKQKAQQLCAEQAYNFILSQNKSEVT